MDFVSFENRESDTVAVKLLALSLEYHAPESRLHFVALEDDSQLVRWLLGRSNVTVHSDVALQHGSYDIKPEILLRFLEKGFDRITWIDSDIILSNALPKRLRDLSNDDLLVTQEWLGRGKPGLHERTRSMGLEPSEAVRDITINSGIVSVTKAHQALLENWQEWLGSTAYRQAQMKPKRERPIGFFTDQEVLAGLIGSIGFEGLHFEALENPNEICQCLRASTYPIQQRLRHSFVGTPAFVHALGQRKPWRNDDRNQVEMQLHPYRFVARRYADSLAQEEVDWVHKSIWQAKLGTLLFFGSPSMAGVPYLMSIAAGKKIRRIGMGVSRRIGMTR